MKSLGNADALTKSTISADLADLANEAHWVEDDQDRGTIGDAIRDQACIMSNLSSDGAKDVKKFRADFDSGSKAQTLQDDANKVLGDSDGPSNEQTALDDLLSQAIAYAAGNYKTGVVDPKWVSLSRPVKPGA